MPNLCWEAAGTLSDYKESPIHAAACRLLSIPPMRLSLPLQSTMSRRQGQNSRQEKVSTRFLESSTLLIIVCTVQYPPWSAKSHFRWKVDTSDTTYNVKMKIQDKEVSPLTNSALSFLVNDVRILSPCFTVSAMPLPIIIFSARWQGFSCQAWRRGLLTHIRFVS